MAQLQVGARRVAPMPSVGLVEAVRGLEHRWDDDELWVAEAADGLWGYVRFVHPDAERVGWIDDLYVRPERSGRGAGSALLELVKAALPDGFGLWAFASNLPALGFYRAHGLRVAERLEAADSPTGEAEVRLSWRRVPALEGLA